MDITFKLDNGNEQRIDEQNIINGLSSAYQKWTIEFGRADEYHCETDFFLRTRLPEPIRHNYVFSIQLGAVMNAIFKYMINTRRNIARYVSQNGKTGQRILPILMEWSDVRLQNTGSLK